MGRKLPATPGLDSLYLKSRGGTRALNLTRVVREIMEEFVRAHGTYPGSPDSGDLTGLVKSTVQYISSGGGLTVEKLSDLVAEVSNGNVIEFFLLHRAVREIAAADGLDARQNLWQKFLGIVSAEHRPRVLRHYEEFAKLGPATSEMAIDLADQMLEVAKTAYETGHRRARQKPKESP